MVSPARHFRVRYALLSPQRLNRLGMTLKRSYQTLGIHIKDLD